MASVVRNLGSPPETPTFLVTIQKIERQERKKLVRQRRNMTFAS